MALGVDRMRHWLRSARQEPDIPSIAEKLASLVLAGECSVAIPIARLRVARTVKAIVGQCRASARSASANASPELRRRSWSRDGEIVELG
jgi:hypothetical protein